MPKTVATKEKEEETPTNGVVAEEVVAGVVLKSSQQQEPWELEELAKAKEENKSEDEKTEDTLSALEADIERITPEEAEQILDEIAENDGRLHFTVKHCGEEQETVYYCRLPDRDESWESERKQTALLHRLRTGTKAENFEDRIPTVAEFVTDLYEGLPAHQRTEIDAIQNDPLRSVQAKNADMLAVFSGSAYFSLIQNTAEVLALDRYHTELASCVIERKTSDEDFERVWATGKIFREEAIDVSNDVIRAMQVIHRKLQSARFLRSSSAEPPDGATAKALPRNIN